MRAYKSVCTRFLEAPRETKIGSRNRGMTVEKLKGNGFWFELYGCLRNPGFKKSMH